MRIHFKLPPRFFAAAFLAVLALPIPAHAASKEIIELQTQVQQLLDMVQRLQSTFDTRFGVLQRLVEQTADNANQMTVSVNTLEKKINAQSDAANGKMDTVSGQVQSLNDSVDELKSRIAKLDKSVQDMQTQLQNIQTAAPATAPPGAPGATQPGQPLSGAGQPGAGPGTAQTPAAAQAPPLAATFQAGVRDYNSAHYEVATGEFQDVIHYYPMDDLAGTSQFYLGEIAYRQENFADAVKDYNSVLEGFPGSPKAPVAQLRKGLALLALNKKDAGIHELRLLIQRHPQTQEAAQARSKLNALGVRITPAPAPAAR
jgi:TolA-binding protein